MVITVILYLRKCISGLIMNKTKFGNQQGIVLLWVLMVFLIIVIISSTLIAMTLTEYRITLNNKQGIQAYYLAEAGIQIALHYLHHYPEYRGELLNDPSYEKPLLVGDGRINSIIISDEFDCIKLVSEAEVGNVKKRAEVLLEIKFFEDK